MVDTRDGHVVEPALLTYAPPAISADGRHMAWMGLRDGRRRLFAAPAAGGPPRDLGDLDAGAVFYAAHGFLEDVLFVHDGTAHPATHLATFTLPGGSRREVTGQRILVDPRAGIVVKGGSGELERVDARTGERRRLGRIEGERPLALLAVSPDARHVVLQARHPTPSSPGFFGELWGFSVEDATLRRISDGQAPVAATPVRWESGKLHVVVTARDARSPSVDPAWLVLLRAAER
jgi:hypothetical protein